MAPINPLRTVDKKNGKSLLSVTGLKLLQLERETGDRIVQSLVAPRSKSQNRSVIFGMTTKNAFGRLSSFGRDLGSTARLRR